MAQTQEHPQDALHRLIYTPHKIIANAGEILADQLSRELVD